MLKILINQCDSRELTARLKQGATNSTLYSAFGDVPRVTDISTDTRSVMAPGYRLIRLDQRMGVSSDGFEIALLNDVTASVAYYSKVKVTVTSPSSPRAIAHCFVWRSPDARHAGMVREVSQSVLFNYIVERYDVILSDSQEIGAGRFLWQRQASAAIAYGLGVSYLGLAEQLRPIPTQEELNDLIDQLWSETHEQEDHLVVISKAGHPTESLRGSSGHEA